MHTLRNVVTIFLILLLVSCKKKDETTPSPTPPPPPQINADIFVVGTKDYDHNGTLWKNNTSTSLTTKGTANSVYVSNNDVYVAGSENGKATYWKNGTPVYLADGEAYSIFVS